MIESIAPNAAVRTAARKHAKCLGSKDTNQFRLAQSHHRYTDAVNKQLADHEAEQLAIQTRKEIAEYEESIAVPCGAD